MLRTAPLLLAAATLLGGCAQEYRTFEAPPLDFSDRRPLMLRVEEVRVQGAPELPATPVQATAPVPPDVAARQLLKYRLRAAGGTGAVQATILEASVVEQPLETAGGLRGYVVNEAAARLIGRLKVRLDRLDEQGELVSTLSTAVSRTAAIPEDAIYARRQEIGYELVRDLVDDLDAGLIANLQQSLSTLITPTS